MNFSLNNKKTYSFYSLIYNDNNSQRIFAYSFFGKKIIDIFFGENNYVVVGNKNILYLVSKNKIDKQVSLFYFFKDILKGIKLNNAQILKKCIVGQFNNYNVVSCEDSNYKKVYFYDLNGNIKREFNILDDNHIILKVDNNILEITIKDKMKRTNFKKDFFDYVKDFQIISLKNMKAIEDSLLK